MSIVRIEEEGMATKPSGGGGGNVQVYGVVIDQALASQDVSLEQLKMLRDQARSALTAQSGLAEALGRLEVEISQREK
jgi:Domain of unknown function (DUF1843)